MKKNLALLSLLFLTAAGCSPFSQAAVVGMVKTVNGGVDWQYINTLKEDGNLNQARISKIVFDPRNRETLFAASYNQGIYKSEDSGQTWQPILSKIAVYDIAVDPADPQKIYAAGFYDGFGKVLKTEDGGKTWNEAYNEQGKENPVRAIALNPDNPRELVAGTQAGNMVKSLDSGKNWQYVHNFSDRVQRILWHKGKIYVLTQKNGLFETVDGISFVQLTKALGQNLSFSTLSYNQEAVREYSQVFLDSLTGTILYLATDRGLYKSTDAGKVWVFMPLPIKVGESFVRAVAVSKSNSSVVYASVGSTIYKSLDGGQSFQTQAVSTSAFVNFILIDPDLPQIAYAGLYASQ